MKYPPDQPEGWPPANIVALSGTLTRSDFGSMSRERFADFIREVISLVDPMRAKNVRTIFDINDQDFLFDKAATLLGILASIDRNASQDQRAEGADLLLRVVATRDAEVLSLLLEMMQTHDDGIHDIALALNIRRRIEVAKKRLPAKGEIRTQMIKAGCRLKEDDAKGWLRLWKDSGLTYLPKSPPHRGPTKHGETTRRKEA